MFSIAQSLERRTSHGYCNEDSYTCYQRYDYFLNTNPLQSIVAPAEEKNESYIVYKRPPVVVGGTIVDSELHSHDPDVRLGLAGFELSDAASLAALKGYTEYWFFILLE